jgi:hypothetical protein
MDRRVVVAVVAAALGAFLGVAGVGHAYLRRWRRAAAWFSAVMAVSLALIFAFTDPEVVTADTLPPVVVVPLVGLLLASVADAYLVGRRGRSPSGEEGPRCPSCGRGVDAGIDFCWYCGAPTAEDEADATSR